MWLWLSVILTASSLVLFGIWVGGPFVRGMNQSVSLGPLWLRVLWPWVEALTPWCRPRMSWHLRNRYTRLLAEAGQSAPWCAARLCAFQCVLALLAALVCVMLMRGILSLPSLFLCAVALALLAAAWPLLRLREQIQRRRLHMARELPFLLDIVTLCVEAGLNLHGALIQAAEHGPPGPLRDELRHMLADQRAGASRGDALQMWAERCGLAELHHFVAAVLQADQFGMSLAPVLRAQADQRRNERFLRAERLALEAPVKLMFPLIFCIFPCTFLIIAFPIASQFLGLLES